MNRWVLVGAALVAYAVVVFILEVVIGRLFGLTVELLLFMPIWTLAVGLGLFLGRWAVR